MNTLRVIGIGSVQRLGEVHLGVLGEGELPGLPRFEFQLPEIEGLGLRAPHGEGNLTCVIADVGRTDVRFPIRVEVGRQVGLRAVLEQEEITPREEGRAFEEALGRRAWTPDEDHAAQLA